MDLEAAVRGAHRRDRLLRAVEVACLSISVALAVLALATLADATFVGAVLAAGLGTGCAAWLFMRGTKAPADTAAALDRRLGLAGALATAFESVSDERPLAQLLVRRTSAAVDARRLLAAVQAPSALAPAVALAATGLLLFALERGPRTGATPATPAAVTAAARELQGLFAARGEQAEGLDALPPELEPALERLTRALDKRDLTGAREAAGELLAGLENTLPSPDEPARAHRQEEIAAASELLRALDAGLPGDPGVGGGGDAPLRSAGLERRMSGSPAPVPMPPVLPASPTPALSPGESAPEAATSAGRFWPRSYDAVVEGWLEARKPRER